MSNLDKRLLELRRDEGGARGHQDSGAVVGGPGVGHGDEVATHMHDLEGEMIR